MFFSNKVNGNFAEIYFYGRLIFSLESNLRRDIYIEIGDFIESYNKIHDNYCKKLGTLL